MRGTVTWLCLVVMLAIGAIGASSAWGAEYALEGIPEFGHCVPAAVPHTGEYAGRNCLSPAAGKGSYNWEPGPAGPKPKFEGQLSKFKLETVGKKFDIECSFGVAKGEYKSGKTLSALFELIGCLRAETLQKCQQSPAKEGEMELQFEGELGFIKGGEKPRVGLDLKPSSPIALTCGLPPEIPTPVSVEGSAIGKIQRIDSMREAFALTYVAPGGKQNPESFEGGPKDTLTQNWIDTEAHSEQVGLTIIGVEEKPKPLFIENEEPIEIKAK
jgi:hypothetical protein